MNDDQLLRYSRHLLLNEIGVEGQERITQSHALVIGAGGLGSPAILYLATAGVGHITIVDNDTVDVTNSPTPPPMWVHTKRNQRSKK